MTFKELLKSQRVTQKQLADLLGLSQPCVSKWIRNESIPTRENIDNIAKALKVNKMLVIQAFYN